MAMPISPVNKLEVWPGKLDIFPDMRSDLLTFKEEEKDCNGRSTCATRGI